ncbi:SDR family oxidoreductase [Phreatobacter sp.]|uniref:SDR family oxidoreductase n=1 Tax=Phreatobacter sp. TaxID=1966341 RepID=UPI003F6F0C9C
MKVLVLGAYGLIGSAVTAALIAAGHEVTGLGRRTAQAARRWPQARWVERDLREMTAARDWTALTEGMDAVVNAAGVLQDGPDDDVAAVQTHAMRALFEACQAQGGVRVVQVSAAGADPGASTRFMTSKVEADAALATSSLDWVILRPGLVFGSPAYGATGLLRAAAAVPLVLPVAFGATRFQTVSLDEVARAVVLAIEGQVPQRRSYDLVEDEPRTLASLLVSLRGWLGLPPARLLAIPDGLARLAFRIGDGLGLLGWRSPVRSTALRQMEAGVTGDPGAWREATGRGLASFDTTLAATPASVQERWFARLWLMKPVVIATLVLFWLASGVIGLIRLDQAASVLTTRGMGRDLAVFFVLAGAAADIAVGIAAAFRRTLVPAAIGMILVTLGYLGAATVLTPDLWLDPLGPMVKTLPALVLALVAMAIAGDR